MIIQKLKILLSKGIPAAMLEVSLIFVGITLAIAFENWNSERNERREELALLGELKSNLEENQKILKLMIAANERSIVSYEHVIAHIGERKPYSDELAPHFARLDNWASPYLTSSAYETLRGRGLDLISDRSLRRKIVNLFEVNYVTLADDIDRAEWINYEVSTVPMMLRYFEDRSDTEAVPIDYNKLIDEQDFTVAVKRTIEIRRKGVRGLRASVEETSEVISSIAQATGI